MVCWGRPAWTKQQQQQQQHHFAAALHQASINGCPHLTSLACLAVVANIQ
jgi:hypothetical protein